jgi:hypothetical protein
VSITITLQRSPRRGTVQIGTRRADLATWHKVPDGLEGTTTDGEPVRLTVAGGTGNIFIGKSHWFISNARWDGDTFTGETGVTDAEMARMFGEWP